MRRLRQLLGRRGDAGVTLVELVVAMGILSIVLAIVGVAVRGMSQSTVRVTTTGSAMTDVQRVTNRFDKVVPYAAAVNAPGTVGARHYVEVRTDVQAGGQPPRCWQYRLDTATSELAVRTWAPGAASTVSSWSVIASGVEVPTGEQPFVFLPANGDYKRQRLSVAVDVETTSGPAVPLRVTWVARNADTTAPTNTIPLGQSTYPLTCTEVSRS